MDLSASETQEYNIGTSTTDTHTLHPTKIFQFPRPDYPEQGHIGAVYSIQLAGKYLISCGQDRSIRIWNVDTQQLVRAIVDAHKASVLSVWYNESTDTITSGGTDGSLNVWRFSTGEVVHKIENAHDGSVLNVRCDRRYIVSGGKDQTIKLWDKRDYSLKWTYHGHTAAVNAVRITEHYVVSASGDRYIKLWSLGNGELLKTIQGHRTGVAGLEVVGDAKTIVSASSDETVRIWDGASGTELACLKGHRELVRNVALKLGNGNHMDAGQPGECVPELIFSASYDGSAVVWRQNANVQWTEGFRLDFKETLHSLGGDGADPKQGRVYSVQSDGKTIICSGQAGKIVGCQVIRGRSAL